MFEQVTQRNRDPRHPLFFLIGCVVIAVLVAFAVLAPKLWPAEIPPQFLAKTAPLHLPVMTGNPVPPHVSIINVVKGPVVPRVLPRRLFVPPVLTIPAHVPRELPSADSPEILSDPGTADAPPNRGLYCPLCAAGPSCPGCLGSDPRFVAPSPPLPAKPKVPEPVSPESPKRIVVGGVVQEALLLRRVLPVYPSLAKQAGVSGMVKLSAVISAGGTIKELRVISGHPLLVSAALEAVKQWAYKPTELNYQPVEVVTQIDVNFVLNR